MDKSKDIDLLGSLKIAAPCLVAWESMEGSNRVRYCDQCNKNVYNISDMSKPEANEFLKLTASSACVNFYKRVDGTILLDNCPVGLRRLRTLCKATAAAVIALFSVIQSSFLAAVAGDGGKPKQNSPQCSPKAGAAMPRMAGKIAAPTQDSHAILPEPRLAGAPVPMTESVLLRSYKEKAKAALISAMPRKAAVGNAALSISIGTTGAITNVKLVQASPDRYTDRQIVTSVQKMKFAPLPADYALPTLQIYFECREGTSPNN